MKTGKNAFLISDRDLLRYFKPEKQGQANFDVLVKSQKYGWQSKKFKPSLNRGRANLEECKKCSGGLQAATMMWKANAFRYNNREILQRCSATKKLGFL